MRLVDHGSAVANGDAVAGRIPGPPLARPISRCGALAALLSLLGCAAPPGTPSLHEVPERPRLAPAGERAALAEELRSEGVAAWNEAQALRTRTGKSALPPPAWLFEPIRPSPTPGPAPSRPPNPEAAIVAERVRSESDDGSLNSFLRQLVRGQPGAEAVELAADEPAEQPAAPAGRRPPPPDAPALDRFLDQLGGKLAVGRAPRTEPSAAPETSAQPLGASSAPDPAATRVLADPPADDRTPSHTAPPGSPALRAPAPPARPKPSPPGTPASARTPAAVLPPPSPGGTLPIAARAELERVVATAHGQGAGLEVVGRGADPALALERARAVARLLAEIGLPAGGLALRAAGPGEAVELYLVPPRLPRGG